MPENWENPFANALLKIDRAHKHIGDIEKRLRASTDTYGPSLYMDGKTGQQFLHYSLTDRTLRSDLALIVGDAIHNLKSALDIAYRETIRVLSPNGFNSSRTKFIVGSNRQHLESSLTKTAKISAHSPLFDFLVERVKSYRGGDSDICALHDLDIKDKHHLLIPMVTVAGVEGVEVEHENGSINRYTIMLIRPNFFRTPVPLHSKIKNHGEVRFEIKLGEGNVADSEEIVTTLLRFHGKTRQIVRRLQRISLSGRTHD